jgi:hypothetical protein
MGMEPKCTYTISDAVCMTKITFAVTDFDFKPQRNKVQIICNQVTTYLHQTKCSDVINGYV